MKIQLLNAGFWQTVAIQQTLPAAVSVAKEYYGYSAEGEVRIVNDQMEVVWDNWSSEEKRARARVWQDGESPESAREKLERRNVQLTPTMWGQLEARAGVSGNSLSSVIRQLLADALR